MSGVGVQRGETRDADSTLICCRKEQWAKAFPLVRYEFPRASATDHELTCLFRRGLAAIWSEQVRLRTALPLDIHADLLTTRQPWFLETYAKYVLSLEEALAAVDELLPSLHNSPSLPSFKIKSRATVDKNQRRLARALVSLEEQAAESGESSLGICLSKPLMRLSKLPLLMQALLYHTGELKLWRMRRPYRLTILAPLPSPPRSDPTTHEWEKVSNAEPAREGIPTLTHRCSTDTSHGTGGRRSGPLHRG